MLWGGLQPIPSRVVIDGLVLLGLFYSALSSPSKSRMNSLVLAGTCLLLLGTSGITDRWTLTLPIAPFLILQSLRRISFLSSRSWISGTLTFLSVVIVLVAAALSVLFPAVELPTYDGPHNVGLIDFHLNVEFSEDKTCGAHTELPVRLMYPTLEKPKSIPLLNANTVGEFCRQSMLFGAPPPLKSYGWMLHTWKLASLRAKWNAELLPGEERYPIVVFSHGLGGTAEVYTYHASALASQGNLVLLLNHQDGSAPVVHLSNGTLLTFDHDLLQLEKDGKSAEYVKERRLRTELRVQELVAATEALHKLDKEVVPELKMSRLSLRNRIATDDTFWMGHSFGGATALTAAKRRPDLVRSIIAYEPAIDWMPDDARRSLFPTSRLEDFDHLYDGGTGGFGDTNDTSPSLHNIDMLVLFSHEWAYDFKYDSVNALIGMHQKQGIGRPGGVSSVEVVEKAHHSEFADTCMLTPLWMAREVGLTGQRNPLETAKEIHERTKEFLNAVRRRDS